MAKRKSAAALAAIAAGKTLPVFIIQLTCFHIVVTEYLKKPEILQCLQALTEDDFRCGSSTLSTIQEAVKDIHPESAADVSFSLLMPSITHLIIT
jgi:hypothetical protein